MGFITKKQHVTLPKTLLRCTVGQCHRVGEIHAHEIKTVCICSSNDSKSHVSHMLELDPYLGPDMAH